MVMDGLWQWIGEEESRLMVVDESIPLKELHDRIFEKFGINKEEFNLKLSFVTTRNSPQTFDLENNYGLLKNQRIFFFNLKILNLKLL